VDRNGDHRANISGVSLLKQSGTEESAVVGRESSELRKIPGIFSLGRRVYKREEREAKEAQEIRE